MRAVAAPDEAQLGGSQGYPPGPAGPLARHLVADERPENLIASFGGALPALLPHRLVAKAAQPSALPRREPATPFSYLHEGRRLDVDDYFARQRVTGLLVIKDGAIELERYQYGRSERTRFLAASISKSVIGLLVGIALDERRIASIDDLARRYVPALAGNPYGETSIRHLLQMSSGVKFAERYDGADDLAQLIRDTIEQGSAGAATVLLPYRERQVEPGKVFHYSSGDTQALGLVLRSATGMPVSDYLSQRLWQAMGAEDDAAYLVDAAGQEATFAFLHARLRDLGRLGMLVANDGRTGARQVVPAAWVRLATEATEPQAQPYVASSYFGYGHQFWTFPERKRRFAMIGVRGQVVFVDPALRLVLVQTAVWQSAGDRAARAELLALWRGVVERYGSW